MRLKKNTTCLQNALQGSGYGYVHSNRSFRWVTNKYLLIDSKSGSNSNFIYFCGIFSGFSAELQQCSMFPNLTVLEGQAWIKQE